MKKVILIVSLILVSFLFIGCQDTFVTDTIEQGKMELENKEYNKALSSFKEAINERSKDEEIKKLVKIITDFNDGKKLIEEEKFEEAKEVLNSIHKDYVNYSIKDDIDKLKKKIVIYEQNNEYIDSEIISIEQLIIESNYKGAKLKLDGLLIDDLHMSKIQKQKTDKYMKIVDEELIKQKQKVSKQKKKKKKM